MVYKVDCLLSAAVRLKKEDQVQGLPRLPYEFRQVSFLNFKRPLKNVSFLIEAQD